MNERSQQLRIMQSIYQEAFLVISWLGPEEEELGLGLSSIELIGREMDSQNEREDNINLDWISLHPILWEENVEEGRMECYSEAFTSEILVSSLGGSRNGARETTVHDVREM